MKEKEQVPSKEREGLTQAPMKARGVTEGIPASKAGGREEYSHSKPLNFILKPKPKPKPKPNLDLDLSPDLDPSLNPNPMELYPTEGEMERAGRDIVR